MFIVDIDLAYGPKTKDACGMGENSSETGPSSRPTGNFFSVWPTFQPRRVHDFPAAIP